MQTMSNDENVNVGFSEAGPDNLHNPFQGGIPPYTSSHSSITMSLRSRGIEIVSMFDEERILFTFPSSWYTLFFRVYFEGKQSKLCAFDHSFFPSQRIVFVLQNRRRQIKRFAKSIFFPSLVFSLLIFDFSHFYTPFAPKADILKMYS